MNILEVWGNLNPNVKRILFVGGTVGGIGLLMLVSLPDSAIKLGEKQQTIEHLLTDQDTSKVTLQGLAAKIDALRTNNSKLVRQIDQLRADQKEIAKDKGPSRLMQKELADLRSKVQSAERKAHAAAGRIDELEEKGIEVNQEVIEQYINRVGVGSQPISGNNYAAGGIPLIPAMSPVSDDAGDSNQKDSNEVLTRESLGGSQESIIEEEDDNIESSVALYANAEQFFKSASTPMQGSPASAGRSGGTASSRTSSQSQKLNIRSIASGDSKSSTVTAKAKEIQRSRKKEEAAEKSTKDEGVYIPAGSIIEAVVIAGMDAPTAQASKRNPYPALMRFKKEAILPNRYTADIRECFLIVSGYGSLSSERAYLRGETISCINEDGGVLESRFDSFAVGEDGKTGIRGRLVTKAGALIGKAMIAGFGQGLAKALDVSVIPTVNTGSNPGSQVGFQSVLSSDSIRSGAVGGVSTSLEKVADYYLKMADEMTPVIEVDAGRVISFIVNRGVRLKAIK